MDMLCKWRQTTDLDVNLFCIQGDDLTAQTVRKINSALPLPPHYVPEKPRAITSEEKEFNAFTTLRKERSDARLVGVREKRAKAKADAEAAKAK